MYKIFAQSYWIRGALTDIVKDQGGAKQRERVCVRRSRFDSIQNLSGYLPQVILRDNPILLGGPSSLSRYECSLLFLFLPFSFYIYDYPIPYAPPRTCVLLGHSVRQQGIRRWHFPMHAEPIIPIQPSFHCIMVFHCFSFSLTFVFLRYSLVCSESCAVPVRGSQNWCRRTSGDTFCYALSGNFIWKVSG